MKAYESKLKEAIAKQKLGNRFRVFSPLLDQYPQPPLRGGEKATKNVSVRIPTGIYQLLSEVAQKEETTPSQLINNAIFNALLEHFDREDARKIYLETKEEKEDPPRTTNELRQLFIENPDLLKWSDSE